eukprot:2909699-Amphidinium_carterae.3
MTDSMLHGLSSCQREMLRTVIPSEQLRSLRKRKREYSSVMLLQSLTLPEAQEEVEDMYDLAEAYADE